MGFLVVVLGCFVPVSQENHRHHLLLPAAGAAYYRGFVVGVGVRVFKCKNPCIQHTPCCLAAYNTHAYYLLLLLLLHLLLMGTPVPPVYSRCPHPTPPNSHPYVPRQFRPPFF